MAASKCLFGLPGELRSDFRTPSPLPQGEGGTPWGVRKDARPSGRVRARWIRESPQKGGARLPDKPSPQPLSGRRGESRVRARAKSPKARGQGRVGTGTTRRREASRLAPPCADPCEPT